MLRLDFKHSRWFVCKAQGKKAISLETLPMIVLAGVITFWMFRAVTVLVLYGRRESGA